MAIQRNKLDVMMNNPKAIDVSPPKYSQLRQILREQIRSWAAHTAIPSEAELCRDYAVSRTTVRKALDQLIHEGLLYRIQGSGTFVSQPKLSGRYVQSFAGVYEDMLSQGLPVRTRVLEQGFLPAGVAIAESLGVEPGESVFRIARLRLISEEPNHITISHLPGDRFPGINEQDFSKRSLYKVLREDFGVQFTSGRRWVEARTSTDEEAQILGIEPEVPLLILSGTFSDAEGKPVEHGIAKYRSDRSQLEIQILTDDI
jgi:GntR family transcriptional regulator